MKKIKYVTLENFSKNDFSNIKEISNFNNFDEIDIEALLEKNISILNNNLLVIGRQVTFNEINDTIDLLALNETGDLVVIDVKSALIPSSSDFQLLKYASFLKNWTETDIKDQVDYYYNEQNNLNKNVNLILQNFFDDYKKIKFNTTQRMKIVGIYENKKINSVVKFLNDYNINFDIHTITLKRLDNNIIITSKKVNLNKNRIYKTSPRLIEDNKIRHLKNTTDENIKLIEQFNYFLKNNYNVNIDWSNQSYILVKKNNNRFLEYRINKSSLRIKIARKYYDIFDKKSLFKVLETKLNKDLKQSLIFEN